MKRRKTIRNKRENLKAWLRRVSPYLKRQFHIEGMRLRLTNNQRPDKGEVTG